MFSKLESKVRRAKIAEEARVFRSHSDRRLFESELIFGNALEELSSVDIEAAYSDPSVVREEESSSSQMAAASKAQEEARNAQDEARKQIQMASIQKQIDTLHRRSSQQIARLEDRKDSIKMQESSEPGTPKSEAVKVFFMGREGGILNYLVNGELALIAPELKALARKFRIDPVVKDLAAKAKAQLQSESPNMELLKVIKYKLISRIQMLESMEKEKEVAK